MSIKAEPQALRHVRRTQAERSETTQQRIVEASLRILRLRGFQKATMQEIAREAGVSAGALQHHYGSKEILVERIIDFVFRDSNVDGEVWPDVESSLEDRANDFVQRAWRVIYGKPIYLASWHLHFACLASPGLSARMNAKREPWSVNLTKLFLERFPEIQQYSPDPKGFARLIFSTLRGIGILAIFGDDLKTNQDQLNALAHTIVCAARPNE